MRLRAATWLEGARVVLRMIIGLGLTLVAFGVTGRRLWWLKRLALSGQPAPERLEYARANLAGDLKAQLTEVLGQRKLLQTGRTDSDR